MARSKKYKFINGIREQIWMNLDLKTSLKNMPV
jgi:hypothetical protein